MTDEPETNPVADDEPVVTPEVEAEAAEEENTEAEATEGDETEQDGQSDEEADLDEVELNGRTYRIPKDVKSAVMMQADYTRKTQEVAQKARDLAAREAKLEEVDQSIVDAHAEVVTLDRQLAQYQALTPEQWRSIQQEDPDAYRLHRDTFADLKDARKEAVEKRDALKGARAEEAQRATAKRLQEADAELPKIIPGWNAAVEKEVVEFGLSQGIPLSAQQNMLAEDPQNIRILHLAMEGDKALKAKAKAQKLAKAQKTQPAHTLRGSSGKFAPAADTSDFAAFEKLADEKLKKRA